MSNYDTIAESRHFIVLDRYQLGNMPIEDFQNEHPLERDQKHEGGLLLNTPESAGKALA